MTSPDTAALREKAKAAVETIIEDLSDRRGLKHEWGMIDEDVQDEIRDVWTGIVARALADSGLLGREGWRGIENAPKDGTEVLVLGEDGIEHARWTDRMGWENVVHGGMLNDVRPVGWMPAPPAAEGAK